MKGIYAAGFKKPSKIQEKALPMLLLNPCVPPTMTSALRDSNGNTDGALYRPRNLIGQSQSGTGKTAAFTLNMLSRVDPALMTPQVSVARSRTASGLSRGSCLLARLTLCRQSASLHLANSLVRSRRS